MTFWNYLKYKNKTKYILHVWNKRQLAITNDIISILTHFRLPFYIPQNVIKKQKLKESQKV